MHSTGLIVGDTTHEPVSLVIVRLLLCDGYCANGLFDRDWLATDTVFQISNRHGEIVPPLFSC